MKLKTARLLIGILALAGISVHAGAQERITIGGGPLGGSFYSLAIGLAKILNTNIPGTSAAVEVNNGSSHNVQLVQNKGVDIGITNASVLLAGMNGDGWAKGKKHEDVRIIMATQLSYIHYWTPAKTGITKLDDINGRIVNLSSKGSGADITGRKIIETLGLKPSKITNLGHNEANQAMQDGLVDVALTAGGVPHPAVASMASVADTVIFGVAGDNAVKFLKVEPALVQASIPADVYKGQTKPVPTIGDWNVIIVSKNMSDDRVYQIMKATFEHLDTWIQVHNAAKETKPENIKDLKQFQIHPGALRYYKEKGIL